MDITQTLITLLDSTNTDKLLDSTNTDNTNYWTAQTGSSLKDFYPSYSARVNIKALTDAMKEMSGPRYLVLRRLATGSVTRVVICCNRLAFELCAEPSSLILGTRHSVQTPPGWKLTELCTEPSSLILGTRHSVQTQPGWKLTTPLGTSDPVV